MTRAFCLPLVLMAALLLGGCAGRQAPPREPAAQAPQEGGAPARKPGRARGPLTEAGTVPIEKVPFRTGVSSATVEKLGKQHGCTGGQGAGLLTEPGPVEMYRMECDNGTVFMARCELRQCTRK